MPPFDLSQVLRTPTGLVRIGENYSIGEQYLSPESYQQAVEFARRPGLPPVSGEVSGGEGREPTVLSSIAGERTFQELQRQLNQWLEGLQTVPKERQYPTDLPKELRDEWDELARKQGEELAPYKQVLDIYDQMVLANEASTRSMLDLVKQQYEQRRADLERINRFTAATYQVAGLRSGAARYAPELNAQNLAAVEIEGLKKLQELDETYRSTVAEANAALKSRNLTLAQEKAGAILKIQQEALEGFRKQMESARKINEEVSAANIRAERDALITEAVNVLGASDTGQLLGYLNANIRKGGQKFTLEELDKAVKTLSGDQKAKWLDFSSDFQDYFNFKENYPEMLPQWVDNPFKYKQYLDSLKPEKPKGAPTFTLGSAKRGQLMALGLPLSNIIALENYMAQFGWDSELEDYLIGLGLDSGKIRTVIGVSGKETEETDGEELY